MKTKVNYERVENTLDQIRFLSEEKIKNVYLKHEDPNVQYKFMFWQISEDKKNVLVYDNHTNVPNYNVVVELENGETHELIIENLNLNKNV